jgi:hypothetical protein
MMPWISFWQAAMAAIHERVGTQLEETLRALHFGIGHGADRGKIVSVLRLEGIIEKVTMIVDNTLICENGRILV